MMSSVPTLLFSNESISSDSSKLSRCIVGDVDCSLVMYFLCFLPSAYAHPLIFSHLFHLIIVIKLRAAAFCFDVNSLASLGLKAFLSFNFVYSIRTAATALLL